MVARCGLRLAAGVPSSMDPNSFLQFRALVTEQKYLGHVYPGTGHLGATIHYWSSWMLVYLGGSIPKKIYSSKSYYKMGFGIPEKFHSQNSYPAPSVIQWGGDNCS
jgi:hypothetical protein